MTKRNLTPAGELLELRRENDRLKADILAVTKRCDELQEAAACWQEVVRRYSNGQNALLADFRRAAAK